MQLKSSLNISTIVNEDLLLNYPEIYHYTDSKGFKGIVSTNTLWATYYSDSSDTTEVNFLRKPLIKVLTKNFAKVLKENPFQTGWKHDAAPGVARDLVDTLHGISGERPDLNLMMDKPFITCFCTHIDEYERKNGLLSQWRAYGGDGGYCIIFDTKRLAFLLSEEYQKHKYVDINISPIIYDNDSIVIEKIFSNLIFNCNVFMKQTMERNYHQPYGNIFNPFLKAATHFKHRAFREEAEIRVVAVPGKKSQNNEDLNLLKQLYSQRTNDKLKRYIVLFDDLKIELPVKRVIVGPSQNQEKNAELARSRLISTIPVFCSETPYLPKG